MYSIFLQPILLGLSIGVFCFTYCVPFIAPYIVAEKRKIKKNLGVILKFIFGQIKKNLGVILKFIFGRFSGYVLFGAVFGYLGEKIASQTVNLILIISLMALSLLLIIYALGFLKPKWSFCCPPFLMSLAYVFTLHSAIKGMVYFIMFFLGTSFYFLPLVFLGFLGKMKEFRLIARIRNEGISINCSSQRFNCGDCFFGLRDILY